MNNINDLRESLFDTINKLKSGEVSGQTANAISNVASNIIHSAKLEMEFMKMHDQNRSAFFLEASKQQELIDTRVRAEAMRLIEERKEEGDSKLTMIAANPNA
jgi:hypothetical protein